MTRPYVLLDLSRQQEPANPSIIPWSPLFIVIMLIAAAVTMLVAGLLTYAILRYRSRAGGGEPRQNFGNRRLEIAWTVAPALLVITVFGFTLREMLSTPTPGAGIPEGRDPDIVVIGHRWWWEFRYPASGVVTANEIHLPVGRQLLLELRSDEVQHDFWVPQLGQKMDMYPGKINHLWIEAERPGVYQGACAEFCGVQHAWMRIIAFAQSPEEYEAWIREQLEPVPPPTDQLAQEGKELFEANTCGSCHYIAGTEFDGQIGPNLTHFGTRTTISAGRLEHTPENLARYLHNPQAVKPGIFMPNYRFTDAEVAALVAYLETLR